MGRLGKALLQPAPSVGLLGAPVLAGPEEEHIGEEDAPPGYPGSRPRWGLDVTSSALNRAQERTGTQVQLCANYSGSLERAKHVISSAHKEANISK